MFNFAVKYLQEKCLIMEDKLSKILLRNGQRAIDYIMNISQEFRQIAIEAIFECLRLGYPLNDMEITSKARQICRLKSVYA